MTLLKVNGAPAKKQIGSFFDDWFNEFAGWGNDGGTAQWTRVPVNIHEANDAFHLEVSAPGLKKEDIKLNVENGLLTISYEKKEEAKNDDYKTVRREFSYHAFKRSFTLSDKVNADDIQAKYEDGVLKVLVPKKPEAQAVSKQISVL
ncbi:MAG: Hsp20/alpha crystallin family protein [Chitinophagaceae bacterium]|nr:Hsp20/alpha crystallin family protein [Chitinophagaceae bacterium]